MKKGNGILVDNRIAEINASLESVESRAHDEAINVGAQNGWTEELANKYSEFLLANDPRFDRAELTKELNYIESHFCDDVPDDAELNQIV